MSSQLGASLAIGDRDLMIELPLRYALGFSEADDEFVFSPFGYEIGARVRFSGFAVGLSWSEMHRGNYSVLRSLSVSTGWYF